MSSSDESADEGDGESDDGGGERGGERVTKETVQAWVKSATGKVSEVFVERCVCDS